MNLDTLAKLSDPLADEPTDPLDNIPQFNIGDFCDFTGLKSGAIRYHARATFPEKSGRHYRFTKREAYFFLRYIETARKKRH